ncbi:ABC transporter ATP-binding protein [Rhodoplanes azumiensis]|uniref:ABC transporter ATP-binding protein n=1 Tax=Rhodoplanes azumiensis TaxID=1897628 RepID=A0ABW5AHK6_9BRAD
MSSDDVAIRCEGLGKRYLVPKRHAGAGALRGLRDHWKEFVGFAGRNEEEDYFWALRDVGFEIKQGEVLGLVGRNGSGKSTLLKILSGVTSPTTGRAMLRGRVGSLLEVGTGFHPDMTGRENIFMAGALLGLRQAEIKAKLDEIIDFAGIDRFIDVPVKRYSSGMYVRLAFSVASLLRSDILILDEALSVGDAVFQQKCFKRLGELRGSECTVVIVSHDLNTISTLCNRMLIMDRGHIKGDGDPSSMTLEYQKILFGGRARVLSEPVDGSVSQGCAAGGVLYESDLATVIDFGIYDSFGNKIDQLQSGDEYCLAFRMRADRPLDGYTLGFAIRDRRSTVLFGITTTSQGMPAPSLRAGEIITCRAPVRMWLSAGIYFVTFGAADERTGQKIAFLDNGIQFEVRGPGKIFTESIVNLEAELQMSREERSLEGSSGIDGLLRRS